MTPAQIAYAKRMPEAELEENIAATCKAMGLLLYHTHWSQHSPSGFLDDVIVGPHKVIYRENKSHTGKVTVDQQTWLDRLAATGADVGVWRPLDWMDGTIIAELTALSTRH